MLPTDFPIKIFVEICSHSAFSRTEWKCWIHKMLCAMHSLEKIEKNTPTPFYDRQIFLYIVSDAEIAQINEQYLNCTGPTNILSFPDGYGLGTLFLSNTTLEREAFLYGQPLRTHAIRLLAHGIGHVHGFDHGLKMDKFCAVLENSVLTENNF